MADTSRADVLTYLENANMMEISELIGEIEEKFGVTAAAPVAAIAAAPADGGSAAADEKEEFDVVLTSAGSFEGFDIDYCIKYSCWRFFL